MLVSGTITAANVFTYTAFEGQLLWLWLGFMTDVRASQLLGIS